MDLTFTDNETAFRDELRAWLADNPAGAPPEDSDGEGYEWRRQWQRRQGRCGHGLFQEGTA